MTAAAIDAGDGLPLTDPRAAARAGRGARRVRAARVRRRRPDLRGRRAQIGGARARSARRGRRQRDARSGSSTRTGASSSSPGSPRPGSAPSAFRSARSRPAPSSAVLLRNADVALLLCASSYRSHDYVAALREAVPELDLGAAPPLVRRLAAGAAPHRVRRPGRGRRSGLVDAMRSRRAGARSSPACSRRPRRPSAPGDRLTIVHTSGSTGEPKGVIHTHGALIRHLDNLNQIRRYTPDEVLFSNSPFFWIGGLAYSLLGTLVAGGRARLLELARCRRRARRARARAAHDGQRLRAVRRPSSARPELREAGPLLDPARQPLPDPARRRPARGPRAAPRDARHDRDRQRVPHERRRVRSARAPARIVRPARARIRGRRRRSRHRLALRSARAGRAPVCAARS